MKKGDLITFDRPVYISTYASCVGTKENEGPLSGKFDVVGEDNRFGEKTWERAECTMLRTACSTALKKGGLETGELDFMMGGDLLNQCITTSFGLRSFDVPFFGLYGACSTMAESLILGSCLVSGGFGNTIMCTASSHFCTAERQYRYPLEYGGQRPQTAQWTATASGAVVLSSQTGKVKITQACPGHIYDPGVSDANNMGAAMAQSAYETLHTYFNKSGAYPNDFDLIVTGDLARVGKGIVIELFAQDGVDISKVYEDCGVLLYRKEQDVHAGGSGCGCSAAVLCAYILPAIEQGLMKRVLFCGTGALLSPISANQGETIPGVCHLVCLEAAL